MSTKVIPQYKLNAIRADIAAVINACRAVAGQVFCPDCHGWISWWIADTGEVRFRCEKHSPLMGTECLYHPQSEGESLFTPDLKALNDKTHNQRLERLAKMAEFYNDNHIEVVDDDEPVSPEVLTRRRASRVMSKEEADYKVAEVQNKLVADNERRVAAGDVDEEYDQTVDWPEHPERRAEMQTAVLDGMYNGNTHLSAPDENGNRQLIWRGKKTRMWMTKEVCEQRFGVTTQEADPYNPYSDSISVGNVEIA